MYNLLFFYLHIIYRYMSVILFSSFFVPVVVSHWDPNWRTARYVLPILL